MTRNRIYFYCLLPIAYCLLFTSCKKDSFITSSTAFINTVDSVKFDTVFTTVGSITQSFKINNDNDKKLLFDKIKLMGGASSAFTININGLPQSEVSNLTISANDSIYIFVTVKVDPTIANLPFIIQDSIQLQYNGNTKFVQLQAYGQNAHFMKGAVINSTLPTIWNNDLPYVILDSLKIAQGKTLTINKGCRIYCHANAPIIVDGKLTVKGIKSDKVIFTGDRLDFDYKDLPASWPGIYFRETSVSNSLTFAVIKNAYQAIVSLLPSTSLTIPKVTLHQCIIDNAYDAGILCVASSLIADNSLISNCGSNVSLLYGGSYALANCTVASYGNNYVTHKNPVLSMGNYDAANEVNDLTASFINCIFWGENGSVKDEVVFNQNAGAAFNVSFNNCIYKGESADPVGIPFNNSYKNQKPLFDSIDIGRRYYDFHISNMNAPGYNKGVDTTPSFPTDLDSNTRNANGAIDIGSYEKQ